MSEKNGLVKNASFLMMATLISRVIGLLYRSPLGVVLGTVGLGYYGYANNVYVILLLISAYSIPMAVSKVVSERLALKQYRNAQKVFHGALLYAMIVGGVAALVAFFFGNYLLPVNQQQALLALRMLAPTIFFFSNSWRYAWIFSGAQHDDANLDLSDSGADRQCDRQYSGGLAVDQEVCSGRGDACNLWCSRWCDGYRSRCADRSGIYVDRLCGKPEINP